MLPFGSWDLTLRKHHAKPFYFYKFTILSSDMLMEIPYLYRLLKNSSDTTPVLHLHSHIATGNNIELTIILSDALAHGGHPWGPAT